MDFFEYDNRSGDLVFNEYQILLVPEFGKLYDNDRNKCKEDKKGTLKILAKKEFTYLWLKMNKKSPYSQYSQQESHQQSMLSSGLTQEEFDNEDFRSACKKYQEIVGSDRILKMLNAAYNKIDDITDYLENIIDFDERDLNGKPIFKVKDVIAEIKQLAGVIEGVKELEHLYAKGVEAASDLRADAQPGYRD